jgi:hypothetical protein
MLTNASVATPPTIAPTVATPMNGDRAVRDCSALTTATEGACTGEVGAGADVSSACQSIDSCSLGFSGSTAEAVATLVPAQADRELHRIAYRPWTKTEHGTTGNADAQK